MPQTMIALTIAGSDSGGGAGIQADLKSFSANGVYGASVLTALTAQNTQGVQGVFDVPPPFVLEQMRSVFTDMSVGAVKIGMLSNAAIIETVAAGLGEFGARNVVLDPVMVATSGDALIDRDAVSSLRDRLIPLARLITPNLPEAAALLGAPIAASDEAMVDQARALLRLGPEAVLVKGGHGVGPTSTDVLVSAEGVRRFQSVRVATSNTHGTGCTLSAAIAAGLAKGASLETAIGDAKLYVTKAIEAADRLSIGHGHGPTHHFHAWW
ncbi:MAG: bifunctional hydroxymethylpyrimidine kinase/phosphomethylpyrimidine kinase [Beijerinckiaceae bacterium]|nr:bifunctional hydroxymethylpyrimidine kinase/phosphomethylpyrimidine kinase [Beijerinckiaceae bacterium]